MSTAKEQAAFYRSSLPANYGRSQDRLAPGEGFADERRSSFRRASMVIKKLVAELEVEEQTWLQRAAKRVPCLGVLMSICASLFLGSAGMLVKMTSSVHGIQVAVFRAIIQLIVYGAIIHFRRLPYLPEGRERLPVLGRALLGATSITCSYCALKMIPLGDATTIRFSLPIWTLIISYLVLNESCSLFKVTAVVVSIFGVVLIAKPDVSVYALHLVLRALSLEEEAQFEGHRGEYESALASEQVDLGERDHQLEGSLLALCSSICLSLSLVSLRLCKRTPAEITILWLSVISTVIGCLTLLALGELRLPDNLLDLLYILLNGFCGCVGQWFITCALKIEQSGVISLARTFDIQVAFLYSAFLLHEHIRSTSVVGSVLVSLGVVAVVVPKWLAQPAAANQSRQQPAADEQTPVRIRKAANKDADAEAASSLPIKPNRYGSLAASDHHYLHQARGDWDKRASP